MEAWLAYVLREIMLYALPVMMSLTMAGWLEVQLGREKPPERCLHSLSTPVAWALPLAAIAVHQPVVLAFGRPVVPGLKGAALRLVAHLLLLVAGFLLYAWALAVQPAYGLPPLHQWWAKLLMFFNLCVACAHLLPLPGLLCGELVLRFLPLPPAMRTLATQRMSLWSLLLLSLTPLLAAVLGRPVVYPVYQLLAMQAAALAR